MIFYLLTWLLILATSNSFAEEHFNVVLIGDSLIGRASRDYGLLEKIQANLQGKDVSLYGYGPNGAMIADIKNYLDQVLEDLKPDAVILFWDSDCSDVEEKDMTAEQIVHLRGNYTANLIHVVKTIKRSGAFFAALAGPEILGEGIVGKPSKWYAKTPMLNDYREINKDVARAENVEYVDVRQAFLDKIPAVWVINSGLLTKDGEHENERGTQIVADMFSEVLGRWLATNPSPRNIFANKQALGSLDYYYVDVDKDVTSKEATLNELLLAGDRLRTLDLK